MHSRAWPTDRTSINAHFGSLGEFAAMFTVSVRKRRKPQQEDDLG
jgi:hypothetical protein